MKLDRTRYIKSYVDFYEDYKKTRKGLSCKVEKRSDYVRIAKYLFRRLSRRIIRAPFIWKIPKNGGYIGIQAVKMRYKPIDHKRSSELKKRVYLANIHTDGMAFRWRWWKGRYCRIAAGKYYDFDAVTDIPNREVGKRGLAAWVKKCSSDPYLPSYSTATFIPR